MIKLDNGCTVIEQVIHEVSGGVKSITVIAVDSGLGKVIGDMGVVCWEVSPYPVRDSYAAGGGCYGVFEAKKAFIRRTGRDPVSEYMWDKYTPTPSPLSINN